MSERTGSGEAGQVLLCLDTSSDAAVAVCRVGPVDEAGAGAGAGASAPVQVLARARSGDGRRHAETLVPMIRQVLDAAGIDLEAVDAVAVGTGPAPFTGLRVGLATARTFARARGLEAYGVCSLDALALAAMDLAVDQPGTIGPDSAGAGGVAAAPEVLVVTDAKRREVYFARYRADGADPVALAGPAVATPAQVAAEHADLVSAGAVFGPALALSGDAFGIGASPDGAPGTGGVDADVAGRVHRTAPVDPAYLASIVTHRRRHGGDLSLTPRYLRRPDVHVSASRKRAS